MKRLWMSTVSAALATMLWSPQVLAKGGSVDAFLLQPANRSLPESTEALSRRGLRISATEDRLGVPSFAFNERALRAGPTQAKRLATPASADVAAREHLRGVADLYRLTRSDVDGAVLQHVHVPKGAPGAVIARYGRRVNGIEVFRSELKVVMDANQELVALSGYLAPRHAGDEQNAQPAAFRVSAPQAIARAFGDVTGKTLDTRALTPAGTKGDYSQYDVDANLASGHAFATAPRAKKVMFAMPDELVPAYYVEVNTGSASKPDADYFAYVISARDGSVLFKHDLTNAESFTYRTYADPDTKLPYDGPQGTESTPHPTGKPDGYQAPFIAPSLVTLQNFPFSRNDPWLAPNATQTTGNNVDAYADLGGGDGFQVTADVRAPLSDAASRTFGYTYDVTKAPNSSLEQRHAAVVNLFYMNNFLHDWFYDAGFDEASGNAQASNYGRGGLENDSIRAEAQDYGGRNNANMSTPADGSRPRMQQYIFDGIAELAVSTPANLARVYDAYSAVFGPATYDVEADVVLPPTNPDDPSKNDGLRLGCADANGTNPFTGTPFAGKIVVLERGSCSFAFKTFNAQQAGAIAVVLTNSATGALGRLGLSNVAAVDNAIKIPTLMVSKPDGDTWRAELAKGTATKLRMRKTADLDRDGTLDNDIIAHEWGHYISNRLVGNATGLSSHQGRAMGEGWGDFTALLVQVRAEDAAKEQNKNWSGVFGMAGYTQSGGRNQGYYWGIRRVPYTTDMTKNGLTLKHIANGVPLPNHPVAGGQGGTNNSQVHNSGEVWATMLWECYASLLNAYPFEEAQERMKRYVVAGYKATPNAPTFLEARDAILAAAAAADAADYQRFVNAFAKRGAGFGAQVADRGSQDHIGVVESFQTGNTLELVSMTVDDTATGCDRDGVLDAGETGYLNVTVRNVGIGALSGVTATAALNAATSTADLVAALPAGDTLTFGNIARGATATARIPVRLQAAPVASGLAFLGVNVTFLENLSSGSKVGQLRAAVNYDEVASSSNTDTASTVSTPWSGPILGNNPMWKNFNTGSLTYWHGVNANTAVDASLTSPIFVGGAGNFVLSFVHRYSFETDDGAAPFFDAGVLELSVDGGPWTDVFEFDWFQGTTPNAGYVNFIDVDNPFLAERLGYVGLSSGFPNFSQVTVNFGTQFKDREVRVRFRIGSDGGVGAYGWDITNIRVLGAVNPTPFTSRVAETYTGVDGSNAPACNVRPVAEAGAVQTVNERNASGELTVVTLNGSASFDPDAAAGSTLTYEWTQLAGPAVTFSSRTVAEPTFTVEVAQDTVFTFQLVVRDGTDSSTPKTTQVLVRNSNRAPVAVAGVKDNGPTTVDERSGSITLDASASSDEDGEDLHFTWVQKAGPTVTLDDPSSATPTFTPPEVTADTVFGFELVADDGIDASNAATVAITVRQVDRAPVVDAGADVTVKSRATVTLTATASDPDGESISGYEWTQTEGPTVDLTGATTATPSFVAPNVKQNTLLRFSVVATAHGMPSLPSTVDVVVTRFNRKPTLANSGALTVDERTPVEVKATAQDDDGDGITYQWTQLGGPTVTLSGADSLTLSFIAPEVRGPTTLLFRLVARDDLEASEPLDVSVTVRNVLRAPVASAGLPQTVRARSTVTLAGSAIDPDGETITSTYAWVQTEGPTVDLTGANTATPSFTAPQVKEETLLRFSLIATAHGMASTASTVDVTVTRANRKPTLHTSGPVTAQERSAVTLQATSEDADGDGITYQWTQLGGPAINLSGANTPKLTFTAPEVKADTTFVFRLVARDDLDASEPLEVAVTVKNAPRAPTAKTRAAISAGEGDTVTLSAAGSNDPDEQVLAYKWEQLSGPTVTLSGADTSVATFVVPATDTVGAAATFRVTVTDPDGLTSTALVNVQLTNTKSAGCSVGGNGMSGALVPGLTLLGLLLSRRRRKA
jgi:MYXO-CTERM domain-containing protein